MDPRVKLIVTMFEHMKPADVARLQLYYDPQAYFKDPFNEVRGLPAIQAVYQHMFDGLEAPRFKVLDVLVDGNQCFLTWDFSFILRGRPQNVHGSSHLRLSPAGRIQYHRDYWDAAAELYEQLPLLGTVLRWLRRRIGTSTSSSRA
ncbi:nuclear transport factor 2 family protein [Variovorax sp. HJSM1_2]|uniref:nuclear transport factor 2 family protein n=1 Tax=Variovorax sp. HJSM1_2 TaxID=3366263 RepID=UPI003BBF152E